MILPSELHELRIAPIASSHSVSEVTFQDNQDIYFRKTPDPKIAEEDRRILRILNEAICTATIYKLNEVTGNTFCTPSCKVVGENGIPTDLLTSNVPHESLSDHPTNIKGVEKVLRCGGFGVITALRYFLEDPDAEANIGINVDENRLCSIDYGLANYEYLDTQLALFSGEDEFAHGETGRLLSKRIFADRNLITGLLRSARWNENFPFLAHHIFSNFTSDLVTLLEKGQEGLVNQFCLELYASIRALALVQNENFAVEIEKFIDVNVSELRYDHQNMFAKIIVRLKERAQELTMLLQNYPSEELWLKSIKNLLQSKQKAAPQLFQAINEINATIRESSSLASSRCASVASLSGGDTPRNERINELQGSADFTVLEPVRPLPRK